MEAMKPELTPQEPVNEERAPEERVNEETAEIAPALPSVVIVGRPNVGKSTLFNKLTESRRALVSDMPGLTRDRIYGRVKWLGHEFELVDTGGIIPDEEAEIPANILRQARVAIERASLVLLVVDARAGITPLDEE